MASNRSFHGLLDSYHASLVRGWYVTTRERRHSHKVEHNRRLLYRIFEHTHPHAQRLMWELISKDIEGLQGLDTELDLRSPYFMAEYAPDKVISALDPELCGDSNVAIVAFKKAQPTKGGESALPEDGLPARELDFDYQSGAYAVYNWEVFYHAPFTIALHLSKNGRYAEAQRWFHYIFDPTDNSDPNLGPKRFWKVKPFRIDEIEHIEEVLFNLATGDNPIARDSTVRAIGAWRSSPLRPHLVARTRPTAYMYATVMAYLDNLIAWGDSQFQQDTRESINQATQLYVLAANILGPRPQVVPQRGSNRKQTYASLRNRLDEFGNAAVRLEAEIGFDLFPAPQPADEKPEQATLESVGRSLYFCIPRNEKLLTYWDTVADRLFKIRNSLNLQGVFRQLPLFAPPIDPAMLARAIAAGVDIGAIIDGSWDNPLPVKFPILLQKALEIAQEVKSLGAQILSALEKKDGEALAVLRARHEVSMLDLVEAVKYAQWQEAIKAREGVAVSLGNAFQRFRHYDRLLGTDDSQIQLPEFKAFDRELFEGRANPFLEPTVAAGDPEIQIGSSFRDGGHKVSDEEAHELNQLEAAQFGREVAKALGEIGSLLNLIPEAKATAEPIGIGAGITFGGSNLGNLFSMLALIAQYDADRSGHNANMAGKIASFARREQDWAFQRKSAAGELNQLYKQFRSAEIREYITKREHEHHAKQIEQSKEVLEFLTNEKNALSGEQRKTTTEDFYLWMKREAQGLHAKCFQFAYDVAKKAENTLQRQLIGFVDPGQSFIQSTYLSGREGLFAGEKLYLDLKRLEMAYLEDNKREFEITKQISLAEWFPLKLIKFRDSGMCEIPLPESLFDLDCPGHSHRRIKNLAITIPCITGPHASVNCSLTLGESYIRLGAGDYDVDPRHDDGSTFKSLAAAVRSIVTSSAQSDMGMFEPNLSDERYLPFEGGGVICRIALELLGKPRSFDYDTIADVILTIRYTARPDGNRGKAEAAAETWLKNNAARVFSVRHDFASEWAAFKRPMATGEAKASLKFSLTQQHFPYRMEKIKTNAKRLHLFLSGDATGDVDLIRDGKKVGTTQQLVNGAAFDEDSFQATGDFELHFDSNEIDDLWLVVDWSKDDST